MTHTPAGARTIEFINTPVDFLLIGGLSILHYGICASSLKIQELFLPEMLAASGVIVWVINWPHFAATSYRLYHCRENIRQFPITALIIPMLLFGMIYASLKAPATVAPWFLKIFLLWSPYHFSSQTLGVTLLYARRAGLTLSSATLRFLSFFIFLTFLGPSMRAESYDSFVSYYGVSLPSFGLPEWVWPTSKALIVLSGMTALVLLWRSCRAQRTSPPLLLLVPAIAQFCWFIPGSGVKGFSEFVPAYHSLQYLLIAWAMQLKTRLDTHKQTPSPKFVAKESLRWGLINVILGAVLFSTLPWLIHKISGTDLILVTGIVIAAVQIHHFFVDGVIWKLRNPHVLQPLMVNIRALSGGLS